MKKFNEWLKERNKIEEGIADYTPGFIRRPLQNVGMMGKTTAEKERIKELQREIDAADDEEYKQRLQAVALKISNDSALKEYEREQRRKEMEKKERERDTFRPRPNKINQPSIYHLPSYGGGRHPGE